MNAEYIEKIQKDGVTSEVIKGLIGDNIQRHNTMKRLYERYKTSSEGVPIKTREYMINGVKQRDKINNRINNAFDAEIVDTKVGFLFGIPISYVYGEEAGDDIPEMIRRFNIQNGIADLDSESGKIAAICGMSARLMYIDRMGNPAIKKMNPWECIFLSYEGVANPVYAIWYYTVPVDEDGVITDRTRVEFYGQTHRASFLEDKHGNFRQDGTEVPHLFDHCPLFGIANNEELQADAEKVLELIDAYDRSLSDLNNEIESFRLAYLKITGANVDGEELLRMITTGAIAVPEGCDVGFITKMMDIQAMDSQLDRIEANICRFAKHVNLTDEQFSGNQSGEAIKYKMFPLESKCITMERKFVASLRHQYRLLSDAWNKKNLSLRFDPVNMNFVFTRNFPKNLTADADLVTKLAGHVSTKTLLGLLSFIEDPEREIKQIEDEKERIAAYSLPIETEDDDEAA